MRERWLNERRTIERDLFNQEKWHLELDVQPRVLMKRDIFDQERYFRPREVQREGRREGQFRERCLTKGESNDKRKRDD